MTITAPHEPAPWLDVEPDFDDTPPELALTDRAGADRHLVAIDRIEREFALEHAGALAEIERIQQWIAGRYEASTAQADWHRSILHRYHEAVLAVGGPKTIKLPHGELQARAQQPTWEIDAPTFLAWARENLPEAVRPPKVTEPTVDVAAAKRLLTVAHEVAVGDGRAVVTVDGEQARGVFVRERPPKFSTVIAQPEPEDAMSGAEAAEIMADEREHDDHDYDARHGADF